MSFFQSPRLITYVRSRPGLGAVLAAICRRSSARAYMHAIWTLVSPRYINLLAFDRAFSKRNDYLSSVGLLDPELGLGPIEPIGLSVSGSSGRKLSSERRGASRARRELRPDTGMADGTFTGLPDRGALECKISGLVGHRSHLDHLSARWSVGPICMTQISTGEI
jgi:hypothetical protein